MRTCGGPLPRPASAFRAVGTEAEPREGADPPPVGEVCDLGGRAAGARSHISSNGGAGGGGVQPERRNWGTDERGPLKTKKAPKG